MLISSDSAAIKVISDEIVLFAIGNELRQYNIDENSIKLLWKLKRRIHGIQFRKNVILIYGEKQFSILTLNHKKINFICDGFINDWINQGWIFDCGKICLLTFHSVALLIDVDIRFKFYELISKKSCEDKATLYSSLIIGKNWESSVIFGGTALGDIFIWQPSVSSKIIHRLNSAHSGVVFSINVDLKRKLMTSTSDDRSVNFWHLNFKEGQANSHKWEEASIVSYKSAYGHTARVFNAKILSLDDEHPIIASVSEDSNICLWSQNAELLFKRRHHFGATIWDLDYDPMRKIIFSVGSDGNLIKLSIKEALKGYLSKEISTSNLQPENLGKIKFLNEKFLVGLTNRNKLVLSKLGSFWEIVKDFGNSKCTILEVFKNMVALAGYQNVILFTFNENSGKLSLLLENQVLPNIIRSFVFLGTTEFIFCDDKGNCKYAKNNFQTILDIELPPSKEKWITAGIKVENYLLVSNRQGNVYLYYLEDDEFLLKSKIKNLYGLLGVTKFMLTQETEPFYVFESCGHDGTIKTLKLDRGHHKIEIIRSENVPVKWIERVETINSDKFICGFNDNHFVVWERKFDVVLKIPCGGGHRCWDFLINKETNESVFIFIKNKRLFSSSMNLKMLLDAENPISHNYWHMKSCNIINAFSANNSEGVFFSGGEDNLLKCSKVKFNSNEFSLLSEGHSHISSIKSLSIIQRNAREYLVFSAGGRAQICVTNFNVESNSIQDVSDFMLKFNDYERKFHKNVQKIDFDPETRITSIAVEESNQNQFSVFIGCSDGYLRTLKYDLEQSFQLIEDIFVNTCVLHTKIIDLRNVDRKILVIASTDGCIRIWEATLELKSVPLFTFKQHGSGINSLDFKYLNNSLRIASGGDDEQIVFTTIEVNCRESLKFTMKDQKFLKGVHNSQVNGIKFSNCGNFVYSGGVDQQICKTSFNSLETIEKSYTCVPDLKGLQVISVDKTERCIVYGAGLQIL